MRRQLEIYKMFTLPSQGKSEVFLYIVVLSTPILVILFARSIYFSLPDFLLCGVILGISMNSISKTASES